MTVTPPEEQWKPICPYTVNEGDSLADHHGDCPYLRCVQTMKFWVSLHAHWVNA